MEVCAVMVMPHVIASELCVSFEIYSSLMATITSMTRMTAVRQAAAATMRLLFLIDRRVFAPALLHD
jgi:hypothetical protein